MRGLKIQRAAPSNAIDVFPLIKQAAKEKVFFDNPSEKQLKAFYFGPLLQELASPLHIYLLARRGRGYLGYLHAIIVPGRWDGSIELAVVDTIFVTEKRRKMGIGKKLISEFKTLAENLGIRRIEFLTPPATGEHWEKQTGSERIANYMQVRL